MHYRKFRKTVQYYKLKYDLGLSFGRNYLVKKAKTKYVVILDDDFQFVNNTTLYKLYDLQQLAKQNNLTTTKIKNGKVKNKTKKELYNELNKINLKNN